MFKEFNNESQMKQKLSHTERKRKEKVPFLKVNVSESKSSFLNNGTNAPPNLITKGFKQRTVKYKSEHY